MEENRTWNARWIWHQAYPWTSDAGAHEMVYFRREFDVADPYLARLVIDVSADSRYRLFLNGESVSVGPCKGDRSTHYYETVDLSDRLIAGTNVLAVQVLHFAPSGPHLLGIGGPLSIHRAVSGAMLLEGVLLEGNGHSEPLHSDEKWLCKKMPGFKLVPSPIIFFLGGFEDSDGRGVDHGWELPGFDAQGWANAVIVCETSDKFGQLTPWQLAPRPIPPMREEPASFRGITKADDLTAITGYEAMLRDGGERTVRVEAGQSIWLELDAGELVTGYVTLKLRGGSESRIKLLYAECYETASSTLDHRVKGIRDDAEHGILIGEADYYTVTGLGTGELAERYEPFDFRTFRYIRLEAAAKDEPLEIVLLTYRDTGYPLNVQASFSCSDPDYVALWKLSLNTLRRCMHETYEDCPYYEQLQYTMDTRLQMLFSYAVSADDRLARRALFDYHSSALPSGMLQSRYPSEYRQVIPSFSLYWIHMLDEHYLHFGDLALLRRYVPTMTGVLDWFRRMLTSEGLVGPTPQAYWPYFDWCKDWENGTPPAHAKGPLTLLSQMFAAALHTASRIYEAIGWQDAAREAKADAKALNEALIRLCWRPERGLFADGPEVDDYSEHAQVWGVVCGAVQGEEAVRLLERTIEPQVGHMSQLSVPASYELFRMLSRHGLYGKVPSLMARWKAFLHLHLTTLPEVTDDNHPRSDCHAWSALPLSEFTGEILGVKPGSPGYSEIMVAPNLLELSWAKGSVATRHGSVQVKWALDEEAVFRISGIAPDGIPLTVVLPNGKQIEYRDGGPFEASASLRT